MSDYLVNVCGDESNATWLIKGRKNILFEAGMAYSAEKMIENLKRELKGGTLDAVILSHSHYDHVAGLPFIKKEWPDAVVYGSAYAAKILEKQSVRDLMRRLSGDAAKGAGVELPEYDENLMKIDVTVGEGDVLEIGDRKIKVFETPGHTKCSVSYLIDDDVLMASETIGVFKGDWYMPCYLVGYQMALDSIRKLRRSGAKRLFISHLGICSLPESEQNPEQNSEKKPKQNPECEGGQNPVHNLEPVWDFLEAKMEQTKDEIVEIIRTFPDEESRMMEMKARYHDGVVSEKEQPSFAFLLNAAATLKIVQNECMEESV